LWTKIAGTNCTSPLHRRWSRRLKESNTLFARGVPLNARDRLGKTPLAYWREPRDCEMHWFRVWLIERVTSDPDFQREREDRAKIFAFLARSGAVL
jgi:hypothetical protein